MEQPLRRLPASAPRPGRRARSPAPGPSAGGVGRGAPHLRPGGRAGDAGGVREDDQFDRAEAARADRGSGDLTGSNHTEIKGGGVFTAASRAGRNFHFGVREHGMGAVLNGIAYHRGFMPYGGTFLIFS